MDGLITNVFSALKQVRSNVDDLVSEYRSYQDELSSQLNLTQGDISPCLNSRDYVVVRRKDLERLATETMQLKEFLPKVLDTEYLAATGKLSQAEQELLTVSQANSKLSTENKVLQQRTELALGDCEKEKEERFTLQCQVTELTNQLSEQSDYCSSMGLACFTLLWRASRQEEVIPTILGGSATPGFLGLVSCTVQSYVTTYKDQASLPEDSQELQFVLAACGVITNIAASAYGRDFLISSQDGRNLVDVLCDVLREMPEKHQGFQRMKSLVLMSLYNMSINHKAVKYLNQNRDLLPTIGWIIQVEDCSQIRLNSLRLLQSLVLDTDNQAVAHRAIEVLPFSLLTKMSQDKDHDIRQVAMEIMTDLNSQRES